MGNGSLTADVPLGPFLGTLVTVHAARGRQAKLHASRDCSHLRSREVTTVEVHLDAAVLDRLCPSCAAWGPRVRPGTGLGIFLDALCGVGLLYQLHSYSAVGEDEDWDQDEIEAAAALLRVEPQTALDEEDQEDHGWEARQDAERLRDSVFSTWRSAAKSLHQAGATLGMFPWLTEWAEPKLALKKKNLTGLQAQAALFVDAQGLLAAAAAADLDEPRLPLDDQAFKVLGSAAEIRSGLGSLWRTWQRKASDGWDRPEARSYLAYQLVHSIHSRRKGRDEALAGAHLLLASWERHAQEAVTSADPAPKKLVTVTLPRTGDKETSGHGRDTWDGLDTWMLGVLVAYLVDADFDRGAVTLRVPELIADRLLTHAAPLPCTPQSDVSDVPAPDSAVRVSAQIQPGIFDDTPVADRQLVTADHLRVLRAASANADQLYIIFSAEHGAEALPLAALETRCAQGWQGVIIASASDLPSRLIKPWKDHLSEQLDDAANEPVWSERIHDPHSPAFGQRLSVEDGHRVMARLSYPDREHEYNLRTLAIARSVHDLRMLDGGYDHHGRPSHVVPHAVWNALLAMDPLDLEPFAAPSEDRWRSGSAIPLGNLADVQIYTTNADPLVQGKGHSPACGHARDRGVTKDYDLLSVAQILDRDDTDWCSQCGGYTVRRLTAGQLSYYRAAHRLHSVAEKLRPDQPPTQYNLDTAALLSQLDELAQWPVQNKTSLHIADTWRWGKIVDRLHAKAQTWNGAGSTR